MRTLKKVAKGKPQIQEYFAQLSEELPALQELHLSSRVLFQKYGKGLNTREMSQEIRLKLISKIKRRNATQTVAKNIKENLDQLRKYNLLPKVSLDGKLQSSDALGKHLPHITVLVLSKLESESILLTTESEVRALIWYLELLRAIIQKPERFFARAVKALRSRNKNSNRLVGSGKSHEVLKELWRKEGYDWASIDPKNHDKMVDKIDDAFKNEK